MKPAHFLLNLLSLVLSFIFGVCVVGQISVSTSNSNPILKTPEYTKCFNTAENSPHFPRGDTDSSFPQLVDNDDIEWVKIAISKGYNVNERGKQKCTGLILAAKNGNTEMAKVLIDAGANIDLQDAYGSTALMHAVSRRNNELIDLLLANQANIDIPDLFGKTPLMQAAGMGSKITVEKLLAKGAKLTGKVKNGWTLANFAEDHDDIVNLLKQHGME